LSPWTIFGFPPNKANDRKGWLSVISEIDHTVSFFEAPHRVRTTLEEASGYFGNRPIMAGRELTKAHQEFLRGTASQIAAALVAPKGEFTIVVGPLEVPTRECVIVSDDLLAESFGQIVEIGGLGRRAAINRVAREHGLSSREVYLAIERHKKSAV
jgi:16S rRNA (cytidine1402-2'-O)-methyltransferase